MTAVQSKAKIKGDNLEFVGFTFFVKWVSLKEKTLLQLEQVLFLKRFPFMKVFYSMGKPTGCCQSFLPCNKKVFRTWKCVQSP